MSAAVAPQPPASPSASPGGVAGDARPDADLEEQGRPPEGVLGFLSCRRRAPRTLEDAGTTRAYRQCLERGRALSAEQRAAFSKSAWWSDASTKEGARVFLLVPRGPDGDLEGTVDMWGLLSYVVAEMHDHVVVRNLPYAAVWVQAGDHRLWSYSAWSFRRSLHPRFFDNIDAVHVVHPSWTVRIYELALWGWVRLDFWERFFTHERLEFLDRHLDMEKLGLPDDVVEYDAFLDDTGNFMTEQAAMFAGGSFPAEGAEVAAGGPSM